MLQAGSAQHCNLGCVSRPARLGYSLWLYTASEIQAGWRAHLVVPLPGLGVDGLAHGAQDAQGLARVLGHPLVAQRTAARGWPSALCTAASPAGRHVQCHALLVQLWSKCMHDMLHLEIQGSCIRQSAPAICTKAGAWAASRHVHQDTIYLAWQLLQILARWHINTARKVCCTRLHGRTLYLSTMSQARPASGWVGTPSNSTCVAPFTMGPAHPRHCP